MPDPSPFHAGEQAVQARAGETHTAALNGRMIGSTIMAPALPFILKQPWAVLGGVDGTGRVWCTTLEGGPGFAVGSPDGTSIAFDLGRAPLAIANPLATALTPGRAVGLLFIEPATRKRLRVNGRIAEASAHGLRVAVEEAFPNCPRFIQKRLPASGEGLAPGLEPPRHGVRLGEEERRLVERADTFFIATLHPERGVDASHRGGRPGFIELRGDTTLRVPDYPGNGLFQTFGNLEVDARAGWVVPDFTTGGQLMLSGRSRVVWGDPDSQGRTAGTHRFLELNLEHWHWLPPSPHGQRWTFVEASPLNP